jgi:hypothetical protein
MHAEPSVPNETTASTHGIAYVPVGAPERRRFVVRPTLDRWEVVFGATGAGFTYRNRGAAVRAARGAARRHWELRREPADAVLELMPGHSRTLASFGP